MTDGSPTVRRRRLGHILRGLREEIGLTGEDVGAKIDRSGSWVSRVETGRVGLRGRDLTDLLTIYQVDDHVMCDELLALAKAGKQRGWWSKYADTLSGPYATYIGFESEAAEVLAYETLVVHGILQTEAYARAVFGAAMTPPNTDEMMARKIEVRSRRQNLLTKPDPLKVWAILDESVLHRQIGGPEVLADQLSYLAEMSYQQNMTIQVVPFEVGQHAGMIGSFNLVRFASPTDTDIVYIEGVAGDIFVTAEEAQTYQVVFDHLRAAALSPSDSRSMIERAREALARKQREFTVDA